MTFKIRHKESGNMVPVSSLSTALIAILDGQYEDPTDNVGQRLLEEKIAELRAGAFKPATPPPPLSEEERTKIEEHKYAEHWAAARTRFKPVIYVAWQEYGWKQGFLDVTDMRDKITAEPQFALFDPETVSRRIRELADPAVEKPPFLLRIGEEGSGRYAVNAKAVIMV